jgi:hypothetical protein
MTSFAPLSTLAPLCRPALALALSVAALGAHAQAAAGWTADITVRVESTGKQPVTGGGARMGVTGSLEWSTTYEFRGTLPYTQRLRGAVARNQPERDNEQRYESWLARVSSAGLPSSLTVSRLTNEHSSGRVVAVDGEGAAAINRANAGKIGRVEHLRSRTEVKVEGADAAQMGGAYLQIDRVANQIRIEAPTIRINPARAVVTEQSVSRLDKAPAAGEWDRNNTFTPATAQDLRLLPQLPTPIEFVFDVPAQTLADGREITLTQEFKAGFVDYERDASRGVITVVLRRGDAAAAASAAPATGTAAPAAAAAAAAGTAAAVTAARPAPAAAPAAAPASTTAAKPCPPATTAQGQGDPVRAGRDVGGEVGGAVLGGGWGRSIGQSVGGVLGALGGAKKEEPKSTDCPR